MTNIQEIFIPIKGFEGLYEISNFGRVKTVEKIVRFSDGRIRQYPSIFLKLFLHPSGYIKAPLNKKRVAKHATIHRLIALHFIPNPENKPQVNHIDCNKKNNSISNLEWVTHKENTIHAVENGLFKKGENHFNTSLTENQVKEIKTSSLLGSDLSKKFGVTRSTISEIRNSKNWAWLKP